MSWRKICAFFLFVFVLGACSKSTQNDVPAPTDPNSPNGSAGISVPPDVGNGALPDLATAEIIRDYPPFLAALREMFGAPSDEDVVIPYADMSATQGTELSGKGTFLIETTAAAYFFRIPIFTGTWNGTNLDVIFADDTGIIRFTGSVSGGVLNAKIFNRQRLTGANEPICRAYTNGYKDIAICKDKMSEGQQGVKQVGRIEKPVSEIGEWIK